MKRKVNDASRIVINPHRSPAGIEPETTSRKPKPPKHSWWLTNDFGAAHRRELPRILRSTGESIHKEGEPTRA